MATITSTTITTGSPWKAFNSSWVPQNESSAIVGLSPNTERDWYIVRGLLRAVGMPDADPADGYMLAPKNTGDDYTSKRPGVITGLIIVLVAITTVTGTRLALRASMSQMRFGIDDWATIAAAVCHDYFLFLRWQGQGTFQGIVL